MKNNNPLFVKKYKIIINKISISDLRLGSNNESKFNTLLQTQFVRIKFLFLGLCKEIKSQNAFSSYAILKALYESVAAFSYSIIKYQKYKKTNELLKINNLSNKMLLGGRNYKKYSNEYIQPRINKFFKTIDNDFAQEIRSKLNQNTTAVSIVNDYNNFIAEVGHPTFLGLQTSLKKDGVKKIKTNLYRSWNVFDEKQILNYFNRICIYFERYLNKLEKIKNENN